MIFYGIEQEGKFKGLKTLFVAGDHPVELIQRLAIRHECEHIYLGAGRTYTTTLSQDDLVRLLTLRFKLSFEVTYNPDLPDSLASQIHCIYTIKQGSFPLDLSWLLPNHSIKVEDDKKLYMMSVLDAKETSLATLKDDTHYEGDVILVE